MNRSRLSRLEGPIESDMYEYSCILFFYCVKSRRTNSLFTYEKLEERREITNESIKFYIKAYPITGMN